MNLTDITILAETQHFILGHIYEKAYLIRKENSLFEEMGAIYGDPQCGLIDIHGNWCIVAGESVLIWMQGKTMHFTDPVLKGVIKMRQADNNTIHLLTDPWSKDPAIWKLDMRTLETFRVSGFYQMKNKPYTENFDW